MSERSKSDSNDPYHPYIYGLVWEVKYQIIFKYDIFSEFINKVEKIKLQLISICVDLSFELELCESSHKKVSTAQNLDSGIETEVKQTCKKISKEKQLLNILNL